MLRKRITYLVLLIFLSVLAKPAKVTGAWPNGPEVSVPICTADGTQEHPRITTDGAAGAIIVWQDVSSPSSDIYVQRVDARGEVKWTKDGVAICLEKDSQRLPNLVSDGSGGAVIVWWDQRSGSLDLYAQRVNGNGEVQWQPGGVSVCSAPGVQQDFDITTDGEGGAIIAWHDYRARSNAPDIYTQRIDANGKTRWKQDGIIVSRQKGFQRYPSITSDGAGGAIIAWHDWGGKGSDVHVQRVNATGEIMWREHGVLVTDLPKNQSYPDVVSDGSGGAIVAWMDSRAGAGLMDLESGWDLYAQRVSAQGELLWQANGVPLCRVQGDQYDHNAVGDGAGGAFVTWHDQRRGHWDIYAQKLDASGNVQWAEDGMPVCIEDDDQYNPNIVSDGANGVIITWWDKRYFYADIYAQRIDMDGNILWTGGGTAVCVAEGRQQDPYLVSSGVGGAIIAWWDMRRIDADIYAQRIISE
jgi:hypothetical protein